VSGLPASTDVAASSRPHGGGGLEPKPLLRFWHGWLKGQSGLIWLTGLLALIVALGAASYPKLFGWIIDALAALSGASVDGAPLPPELMIVWGPVLVVMITFVRGLGLYGLTVVTNRIAMTATTALQQDLFAKLLQLDFARITAEQSGAFAARFLNDVNAIRDGVIKVVNAAGRDILSLAFLIGVLLWSDWQLALVAILIMPLAVWPVTAIGRRLRKAAGRAQEQAGEMAGAVEESLGGVRLVKTYGLETGEAARVGAALDRRRQLMLKMVELRGRVEPILETLGGLAVGGVFAFAAMRISSGATSVGDLSAFITALLSAAQNVRSIGGLATAVQEGEASLQRFYAILDETPGVVDSPDAIALPPGDGRVAFKDVGFTYANAPTLNGLSFVVEPGQTVALVGPSGAGKTTVFNLIARLYDTSRGRVEVDGHDVRTVTVKSLRARLALVSQDATLFDASVRENLLMGRPDADDAAIVTALRKAACDFVFDNPLGLDAPVGPRGNLLSGGQRQRLSLARAILRDSPVLLLDEATSALDAESEARIQSALAEFSAGRTTILIAHRLASVREADRILVMDQGRIVEEGTHDALIERGGLYAELARLQFQS
jgi:ATP-binding cassette, subfamily B, bacterial MsbA